MLQSPKRAGVTINQCDQETQTDSHRDPPFVALRPATHSRYNYPLPSILARGRKIASDRGYSSRPRGPRTTSSANDQLAMFRLRTPFRVRSARRRELAEWLGSEILEDGFRFGRQALAPSRDAPTSTASALQEGTHRSFVRCGGFEHLPGERRSRIAEWLRRWHLRNQPNGSLTQLRRGPVWQRQSGAPLAATNVKTAGSVCKRRDAEALGIT